MQNKSGYRIHPIVERQQSKDGGLVYVATYTVEDDKGMRGDPITVAGTFASADEAMAAAQQAGGKVLDQV